MPKLTADNVKVGQPEILLGIIPGAGGTHRLPRLIGPARAKELIYTGRFVEAEEALRIGMVDEMVPAADVYRVVRRWTEEFVAGPARALAAAKAAIDDGLDVDLDHGLKLEAQVSAALSGTEDRAAGIRSFLDHGPGKRRLSGADYTLARAATSVSY